MNEYLSIGQAALMLGVSVVTLRRWDKLKQLCPCYITCGGHRRYALSALLSFINPTKPSSRPRRKIGYARVSSHDQKKDLTTQSLRLKQYLGDDSEVICDLGSGLNYKKSGLKRLIKLILNKEVSELVVVHKDRLLRFGSELVFQLCALCGTKVTVSERVEQTFEAELCADVIELMTVFSTRLYGKRSNKNRKALKKD